MKDFWGQEIVVEERKGEPGAVLKSIGEARGRRRARRCLLHT